MRRFLKSISKNYFFFHQKLRILVKFQEIRCIGFFENQAPLRKNFEAAFLLVQRTFYLNKFYMRRRSAYPVARRYISHKILPNLALDLIYQKNVQNKAKKSKSIIKNRWVDAKKLTQIHWNLVGTSNMWPPLQSYCVV